MGEESSPQRISRLISSPTRRKKTAISASLIHSCSESVSGLSAVPTEICVSHRWKYESLHAELDQVRATAVVSRRTIPPSEPMRANSWNGRITRRTILGATFAMGAVMNGICAEGRTARPSGGDLRQLRARQRSTDPPRGVEAGAGRDSASPLRGIPLVIGIGSPAAVLASPRDARQNARSPPRCPEPLTLPIPRSPTAPAPSSFTCRSPPVPLTFRPATLHPSRQALALLAALTLGAGGGVPASPARSARPRVRRAPTRPRPPRSPPRRSPDSRRARSGRR